MIDKKIIIAGGGLAGLISALHLTRAGVPVLVIEKRTYPFHRVCGEYISNEVVPYLKSLDAYPEELHPTNISRFGISSVNGKYATLSLDLGGFGISRYQFDHFLYKKASEQGAEFRLDTEVDKINFADNRFLVSTHEETFSADVAVGAFGKRSKLDVQLGRSFIRKRSPYVGIKYHIHLPGFPDDLIALHNFKDGYCGISRVEGEVINLCYLSHRDNLKTFGNIKVMEEAVLYRNPFLREIFSGSKFLFEKPETINEISFETKEPLLDHVLMSGDAAGMITPLCGNGMAMAIHSAKILCEHIIRFCRDSTYSRMQLEQDYARAWKSTFANRLWAGRQIQRLFGGVWVSNLAVNLANQVKPAAHYLMKKTHGKTF